MTGEVLKRAFRRLTSKDPEDILFTFYVDPRSLCQFLSSSASQDALRQAFLIEGISHVSSFETERSIEVL